MQGAAQKRPRRSSSAFRAGLFADSEPFVDIGFGWWLGVSGNALRASKPVWAFGAFAPGAASNLQDNSSAGDQ